MSSYKKYEKSNIYYNNINQFKINNYFRNKKNSNNLINKKSIDMYNYTHNNMHNDIIDMYNDIINNDKLEIINNNITDFSKKILIYKNILFLCADYPGYGGAATNCYNLSKHFNDNHNVYSIYWNYPNDVNKKYDDNDEYKIIEQSQLHYNLNNLKFKPDIILLKSVSPVDLKLIFKCPLFFIIPGIFKNTLNTYYFNLNDKNLIDKYINNNVLNQIKKSDYSFSNSSHTMNILKNIYNLNTDLFYSSFIQYYKRDIVIDDNFKNRKYEYGLIMSNFDRTIKNVNESIKFLKDKKNVILIGKNSSKYKHLGFECIDLVDNNKMSNYYKQIKYLQQDSYYESCSNVKIESLFNGCKIKKRIVVSSTQYHGYGGAATNAYNIIKYLKDSGYKVCGIFFHDDLNVNYNPDNIEGVFLYHSNTNKKVIIKNTINYLNGIPHLCLCKNYLSPIYCKKLFNCFTIYLVSGFNIMRSYPELSSTDLLDDNFIIDKVNKDEEVCLNIIDKILFNSKLLKDLFLKKYINYSDKFINNIINTSSYNIQNLYYENTKKNIDIILCCSDFKRKQKNNKFLINIINRFQNCIIYIVGKNSDLFNTSNNKNVTLINLVTQNEVIKYLSRSKILLYPSLFDSNPNTVREALAMKCLPIITHNVGYYELYPKILVCDSFDTIEWVNKIKYLLNNFNDLNINIDFNEDYSLIDLINSI